MLVSSSALLDDMAAISIFRRHILSVHGITTEWFEDKVVRAVVVLVVGGSFQVDAEPGVVVDKFFGSVGVSIPANRLVWCLRLQCLQWPLDLHCDTL